MLRFVWQIELKGSARKPSMLQPRLYFYIPQPLWTNEFPRDARCNWSGFGLGVYAWTLQTYLWLQAVGFPCTLVSDLPQEGIIFLHRNAFRYHRRGIEVFPKRLLVCFQGDLMPHPDAQVHIVQNRTQENPKAGAYFMPHWSQPGLQPRNLDRGDRFERLSFLGHTANLAPEFADPQWAKTLEKLGLIWCPVINTNRWDQHHRIDTRWNDYQEIDAIVAVRSFNPAVLKQTKNYFNKPATKLYNAWLVGVPAILGQESGYRAERQSDLDYLEVTSLAETIQAVTRLKEDLVLRQAIVLNGRERSRTLTPEAITEQWFCLIQERLFPAYENWCRWSHWQQKVMVYRSRLSYGSQRLQQRLQDWQYSLIQG